MLFIRQAYIDKILQCRKVIKTKDVFKQGFQEYQFQGFSRKKSPQNLRRKLDKSSSRLNTESAESERKKKKNKLEHTDSTTIAVFELIFSSLQSAIVYSRESQRPKKKNSFRFPTLSECAREYDIAFKAIQCSVRVERKYLDYSNCSHRLTKYHPQVPVTSQNLGQKSK